MTPPLPSSPRLALTVLVLTYGATTLVGQILLLREILVLAQGQELKLALGLWSWLVWTGLGSLLGGPGASRQPPGLVSLTLQVLLLACLLPGTILAARAIPTLFPMAAGATLPPLTALLLFLGLLAPFCLLSGAFFPRACTLFGALEPTGAAGRVYGLESLGAALGVSLLQFLLLGRVPVLPLSAALAAILPVLLWPVLRPVPKAVAAFLGAWVLGFGVLLLFSPWLESFSRRLQWPGHSVAATVDTPYAFLTVTREGEQQSFFANRVWHFTHPDPYSAELAVHPGLLQHPRPKTVLLLGGGAAGVIQEALKTPGLSRLEYVEMDPDLVRLVKERIPEAAALARDPRLTLVYQEARRFLAVTPQRYDVILLNLPEPASVQLNRYYTREFFALVARCLNPQGGVFSFTLTGGETGLNPLRAAFLGVSYHTLKAVFPEVVAFPGERVRFCASNAAGLLVRDPEVLKQRLQERGLDLLYVRDYYLLTDLAPSRQEYLQHLLERQPRELNADLAPQSFFYDLILTAMREGLPTWEVLLAVKKLPLLAFLGLLGALGAGAFLFLRPRPAAMYLAQVAVLGFGVMALEVILLLLCQLHLGLLYRELGLLIAAFMGGMGAGSAVAARFRGEDCLARRLLLLCQGFLALLAMLLALGLLLLRSAGLLLPGALLLVLYLLVLFLAGGAGGGVFALAGRLFHRSGTTLRRRDGLLYAVDLLGATFGSLGLSLLVLPVWGLLPALGLICLLHLWAAGLLFGTRLPPC